MLKQKIPPLYLSTKIYLVGISPMIYRRFQIRGDTNMAELHYIIQIIMGWEDVHLNRFYISR